ncbi:MAG: putative insertion sequence ATP-binding protein y4pL [Nitrospira sp.]|jgi:hypothetical protein|nr:putative insertion sequence ATP-binding protein y4pL [Nitrospira sp.]
MSLIYLYCKHRRDLLKLLDDRHGRRATLVASQLPVDHWHAAIGEPTLVNFDRFMGPLLFPWHRRSGILLWL